MASRTLSVEIIGDASKLERAFGKADSAAGKTESRFGKVGNAAKMAAGAAGVGALVVGLKSTIGAAMDSEKVQNRLESQMKALGMSYDKNAKQIDTVINRTSKLAAVDDEELTQSFTRLLPATKDTGKALEQMGLAADIARAQNISLESATKLVIRANTGSAGALRKLGISMDVTKEAQRGVTAELDAYKRAHDGKVSPAMKEHFAQLMESAKAQDRAGQATKNLAALQQTFGGAAADYGKTSAAAQDRFRVAIENLQEGIGKALLPILADFANHLSDLLGWVEKNQTVVKVLLGTLVGLAVAVKAISVATKVWGAVTKVAAATQWLLNVALTANPIGIVVVALAALAAGLVIAYKKSETFRAVVDKAWDILKKTPLGIVISHLDDLARAVGGAAGKVKSGVEAIVGFFRNAVGEIGRWLGDVPGLITRGILAPLETIGSQVWGKITAIGTAITNGATAIVGWGTTVGTKLRDAVVTVAGTIGAAVWKAITDIGTKISGAAATIAGWGSSIGTGIKNAVATGLTGIWNVAWGVINNIGENIGKAANTIAGWGKSIGSGIKGAVAGGLEGIWNNAWGVINNIGENIAKAAGTIAGWGKRIGSEIKGAIAGGLEGIWNEAWGVINNIGANIAKAAGTIKEWGADIGRAVRKGAVDLIKGVGGYIGLGEAVGDAIRAAGGKIKDAIGDIFGKLEGWVKSLLGIKSPSQVFHDIGVAIVDGLVKGLHSKAGELRKKATDLAGSMKDVLDKIPGGTGAPVPEIPDSAAEGTGGPSSLVPHLWDEYRMARNLGFTDMGIYNPSPENIAMGSDHARWPSGAFDAGFSPATGWENLKARAFFNKMVNRPGIKYVILGGKIWSASRGLHAYGESSSHANHVHVSGYDAGGWLPPGVTLAVNNTGRPERVIAPHQEGRALMHVENMTVSEPVTPELIAAALGRRLMGRH